MNRLDARTVADAPEETLDSTPNTTIACGARFASVEEVPGLGAVPNETAEWLIAGFLPRGALVILCGQPGAMKSWLTLDLTRCIAEGNPFAGRETRQSWVLYLDRENPSTVVNARKKKLNIDDPEGVFYWSLWCLEEPPELGDERILDFARRTKPLIIFDSLIRFHRAKENDATEMAVVTMRLKSLVAAGATVLVLYHKSDKSVNHYRGSSEVLAGCDVAWVVDKKADNRTVEIKGIKNRFAEESSFTIRLETGGFVSTESSSQTKIKTVTEVVAATIAANPGLNQTDLLEKLKGTGVTNRQGKEALKQAGCWKTEPGERNAVLYYPLGEGEEIGEEQRLC